MVGKFTTMRHKKKPPLVGDFGASTTKPRFFQSEREATTSTEKSRTINNGKRVDLPWNSFVQESCPAETRQEEPNTQKRASNVSSSRSGVPSAPTPTRTPPPPAAAAVAAAAARLNMTYSIDNIMESTNGACVFLQGNDKSPICARCHNPITEVPQMLNGVLFHKACFVHGQCSKCHKRIILSETPETVVTGGSHDLLFHKGCFGNNDAKSLSSKSKESLEALRTIEFVNSEHDAPGIGSILYGNMPPDCARCHTTIFGVPEKFKAAGHMLPLHNECAFHGKCAKCHVRIRLGEVPEKLKGGVQELLFHKECFTHGECSRCHKTILLSQAVEKFNGKREMLFHKECFIHGTCGLCHQRVLLNETPKPGEMVFHKECFLLREIE